MGLFSTIYLDSKRDAIVASCSLAQHGIPWKRTEFTSPGHSLDIHPSPNPPYHPMHLSDHFHHSLTTITQSGILSYPRHKNARCYCCTVLCCDSCVIQPGARLTSYRELTTPPKVRYNVSPSALLTYLDILQGKQQIAPFVPLFPAQ